ncbi:flagella basal body P-ring formation protein FlgA [Nitratiruptor sp. YY08-14]|nr:flagella basal body P-ring formation protein FlgA [Nitratiruptor sp. YY08-14]
MLFGRETILLKKQVLVNTPKIELSQIAIIDINNQKLKNYLSHLLIDQKYYKNDSKITKEEVRQLLQENFIDTSHISIKGQQTTVRFQKNTLSKEMIEDMIRKYFKKKYPNKKIRKISLRMKPVAIVGRYTTTIEPETVSRNYAYVRVHIQPADGKEITYRAYLMIKTLANVVVAAHDIPKGSVIQNEDVEVQKAVVHGRNYPDLQEIIGSVAKVNIYKNRKITRYMIEPNYAVKKHQNVRIIYKKGPIMIELLGLALQNGKRGDIIKVKNISTNKVLACKVISDGVVLFLY